MTKAKIAVTLPQSLVARARRAVHAGRADSMSAYIAAALEEKTKLDELAEMLATMLAETGGPLTARERRAADEVLGPARHKRADPRCWRADCIRAQRPRGGCGHRPRP